MCSPRQYNKGCSAIHILQHVPMIGMMGFGATSLDAMTTVVGTPIAIAMDVGALVAGILSLASSQFGKYFSTKLEKHEKNKIIAESKLNTITCNISKSAICDCLCFNKYFMRTSRVSVFISYAHHTFCSSNAHHTFLSDTTLPLKKSVVL